MTVVNISYTVKVTILYKNKTKVFTKDFTSSVENEDPELVYDNVHIINDAQYVLDLFSAEVAEYLAYMGITMDDIIIDEYEIVSQTERVDVYFENPDDPNSFTLSPCIKCYIFPKEEPLDVPVLNGTAIDQGSIRWTWEDDGCAHLLVTQPFGSDEEENKKFLIADLPIGRTEYIEAGLEPNTSYTRRLIAYTPSQTSFPSGGCTVMTETVNPVHSLKDYFINREQDWTITDDERSYVMEHMVAMHPGVGDLLDCKVYKQGDDDFYEKFKGYFILKGAYTKREKRYEQVGFRYKIILEAIEEIEEMEGDITFKLTAYPWQEVYCNEYLWAVLPVNVYAKVFATVQLFKKTEATYYDTVEKTVKIDTVEREPYEELEFPMQYILCVDLSGSMAQENGDNGTTRFSIVMKGIHRFLHKLVKLLRKTRVPGIDTSKLTKVPAFNGSDTAAGLHELVKKDIDILNDDAIEIKIKVIGFARRVGTFENMRLGDAVVFFRKFNVSKEYNTYKYGTKDFGVNQPESYIGKENIGHMTNYPGALYKAAQFIEKNYSTKYNLYFMFFSDGYPWMYNLGDNTQMMDYDYNYYPQSYKSETRIKYGYIGSIGLLDRVNEAANHLKKVITKTVKKNAYAGTIFTNKPSVVTKTMDTAWTGGAYINSFDASEIGGTPPPETNAKWAKDWAKSIISAFKVLSVKGKITYVNTAIGNHTIGQAVNEFFETCIIVNEKVEETPNTITKKISVRVELPIKNTEVKNIQIESELLKFTFDETTTRVSYNDTTKRAELMNVMSTQKMLTNAGTLKSVRQLLDEALEAAKAVNPDLADYKPSEITDEATGEVVGSLFKNIHIKDTYGYTDGMSHDITGFDSGTGWEYGRKGTVNTFTNIADASVLTPDEADDIYIALDDSYVWIDGYCEGIIYEGTRYGHANVCAYYKCAPQVTMFYRSDVPELLRNRMAPKLHYTGPVDTAHVFKRQLLLKTPEPNYTVITGDGIDTDMNVSISTAWESPKLEYRFNMLDPNAYTQFFEILPDAYRDSTDKHCIVVDVYKAHNVMAYADTYISSFDCENPVQPPMLLEYGLNSTWNAAEGIYDCDGKYIQEYIYFHSLRMLKTRPYRDVLPPEGQDLYYGLVNGRFREDNPEGKQDLIVDTPQFNIPSSVLAKHAGSVKIYIEVSEFQPENALIEYWWHHENPLGSGYTKTNGDYVTFTCDSPTMMDIEHEDIISTIQTDYMELYNQKPYEVIQQIQRPVSETEKDDIKEYAFKDLEDLSIGCSPGAGNSIIISPAGMLGGPGEELRAGRHLLSLKGSGLNMVTCTVKDVDNLEIPCEVSLAEDGTEANVYFTLYQKHYGVNAEIINPSAENVTVTKYKFGRTSGFYEHYYLEGYTDNGDVMVSKCPHEIFFDDNNLCEVPVTYQGIINATSRWAPRVHNGYYYFNQHEHFLYAETMFDADFIKTVDTKFGNTSVFILFKVSLLQEGGPAENYELNKDTRPELLQNENRFVWVDKEGDTPYYGLTLKPVEHGTDLNNDGKVYRHYNSYTWESPILGFPKTLTSAGPLTIDYINTDGTNTGLEFMIRAYDTENARWPSWSEAEPFTNGSVPSKLSAGYQIKCVLSATETHHDMVWDDYLCCYLDWCDYLEEFVSYNINTSTDHITVGPLERPGRAVSRIISFACPSGMELSMYQSTADAVLYAAYSNSYDDLLMENITWVPASAVSKTMKYKYYRFKIEIPYGTNIYWVHIDVRTQYTDAVLPYIRSIRMTGTHVPEDRKAEFTNLESFQIPADGAMHEIIPKISRYIESDIIQKGFTRDNIESLEIICRDKGAYIAYDPGIDFKPLAAPWLIDTPVSAAVEEEYIDITDESPFIKVSDGKITINGTPQQYCPITVEDESGRTYKRIYGVSREDLRITERFEVSETNNYVMLKRTDFEPETMKVWINDVQTEDYDIINHIIMFKENYVPDDVITVSYNVLYSFFAETDRKNGTTEVYTYPAGDAFKVRFETGLRNNRYRTALSMNPIYRTEYSGFIYMTREHNEPYKVRIFCNPRRIKHGCMDNVDLNIEVVDTLDNPVISKEVSIDCSHGTIECDNRITDANGVVHAVYYSSFAPSTDTVTAKVLNDSLVNVTESITIRNY